MYRTQSSYDQRARSNPLARFSFGASMAARYTNLTVLSAKAGRAGKDLGKKGRNFAKIASKAGAEYGSKAAGERVAGSILAKMRAKAKR